MPPSRLLSPPTHPQHQRRLHEGGQQFGQRHVHVGGSLSLTSPSSMRRPVGSIPAAGSRWLSARDRTKPPREASIPPRPPPACTSSLPQALLSRAAPFPQTAGLKMFKTWLTFNKTGQNKKTDEAKRRNSCYFCAQISSNTQEGTTLDPNFQDSCWRCQGYTTRTLNLAKPP